MELLILFLITRFCVLVDDAWLGSERLDTLGDQFISRVFKVEFADVSGADF